MTFTATITAMLARLDVSRIGAVAGPLVAAGYLLGSVPWAVLISGRVADERRAGRLGVAVDAVVPLAVATTAWWIVERIAPGGQGGFAATSPIAFLSAQAITVWQSIALWAGAAALVGQAAPVWQGFRGRAGTGGAVLLALAYAPITLVVGLGAYTVTMAVSRSRRTAVLTALFAAVTASWLAWTLVWRAAWGNNPGPEMSLWTAAVASVLAAGLLREPDQ